MRERPYKEHKYQVFTQLNEESQAFVQIMRQAVEDFFSYCKQEPDNLWQEMSNVSNIYLKWLSEVASNPLHIYQASYHFYSDFLKFIQHFQKGIYTNDLAAYIEPNKEDRRFKSEDWQKKPWFYFYQQFYLLYTQHTQQFVENNKSRDPKLAKQVSFFTQQYLDAFSPSNFILTNPDVLKHTIESNGQNLALGFKHFLKDLVRGQGHWNIKMTDMNAFKMGENLAMTPGKVVFRNRLIELIQYEPTTKNVNQYPLLMVPPWINKYYILDLRENNSFVKWIVSQGITVFMISWVNPDASYKDTTFEDYLIEGFLAAVQSVKMVTNQNKLNTLGFCVGGTLLSMGLAYLKALNDQSISSATFLTTLIDFTDAGDITAFIDEDQIKAIEKRMHDEGYLDGRLLMTTFNLLRSNDLLWSFYINNYLCGKEPFPFDLLFWNCDSTNLPEKMHSYYLRNMYLNNLLVKNALVINNYRLDLSKISTPCYFFSAEQDHIAPWKGTYVGAQAMNSEVTFVLGGSGHIAGVINPPANNKYHYRYNNGSFKQFQNSQQWFEQASQNSGSWWTHWIQWLTKHSGSTVPARIPGEGALPALCDAPGQYVLKKLA